MIYFQKPENYKAICRLGRKALKALRKLHKKDAAAIRAKE